MKLQRCAGVLLHPTSFPGSYGIGDLSNRDFIDFLYKAKQKLWQVLPLGPTGFGDSPYQSFSSFAGNTLLLSPKMLHGRGYLSLRDVEPPYFSSKFIDYGKVYIYKKALHKKAYENFKKSTFGKTEYRSFVKENAHWLEDYALFTALKEFFMIQRKKEGKTKEYEAYRKKNFKYMTESEIDDCYFGALWTSWPKDTADRESAAISRWRKELEDKIDLEKFLQYEFYRQWDLLKIYANTKGIQIIGDIPIFVAYDSADTWADKELFFLDKTGNPTKVAGVPPDYFSEEGQLWGNPLYNWKIHKETGFKWWISRVEAVLKLVDIVRIDHFRGFESYWAVKFGKKTAIDGKWEKGIGKDLFIEMKKQIGDLPIIAEDLGIITPPVEKLRDDLELPGMKILQFAFGDDNENAYLPHNLTTTNCVIYTGTHDNNTSVGWYNTASEKEKDYLRRYLNVSGEDIAWDMIRLAYSSTAAFALVPLQDLLSQDSHFRMNTPGQAADNWQYRYQQGKLTDGIAEGLEYLVELFNR